MIQHQVKSIVTSKWNIFIFSVSMMPTLAGWKDFFIKYGENLDIIFLAVFTMIILFGVYQYQKKREQKENLINESKAIDNQVPEKVIASKKGLNYIKILAGLSFMLFAFTLSFLYFLKDAPVYYVKVSGNLNSQEAVAKKQEIRNQFLENERDEFVPTIRRRSIRNQKNNYFLSINGAFLDKGKAELQMDQIKQLLKNNGSINLIESKNAHITRKIEYLIAHFIPYKILAIF
jgi:hypothetical protein